MLGILAVIFFALGFLFHGAGFHSSAWLDWESMLLAGLVCLALHMLGVAPLAIVRRQQ